MKKFLNICWQDGAIGAWICLIVSVILIVISFIIPPTGYIDASVLQAVAELGFFATLFKLPNIIQSIKDGKSVSVKKGDFEVNVSSEKGNEEEKTEE